MLKLYSFHWDCGRSGDLDGLFVAEEDQVESAIGKRLYFGEVLGKHSDVEGILEASDLEEVSSEQDKITWLVDLLGTSISGFNPLEALAEEEEDEEDDSVSFD
jgi:hypothetical protein